MLLFCSFSLSFQLAVDGDVGVLVETRVRLHTRFRLGAAFEDHIVVFEETHTPFERFDRMVVLKCMRLTLRLFDQFAVGDARRRPVGREMVRI